MPTQPPRIVALAWTGASGLGYGLHLLSSLIQSGVEVWLIYSQAAQLVAKQELDLTLPTRPIDAERELGARFEAKDGQLRVFGRDDWNAPLASGSNPPDAMAVCPCTMGTLAAIAAGLADNLIERAADVMLKEQKKLILVPRETPFSAIHLENMLTLARAGAVVLPANPAFYHRPPNVEAVVDYIVARVLDHLGVSNDLMQRWGADRVHREP
jgi:flavin prenyltransferase